MFPWKKNTHRQWKQSADDAVALSRFGGERDRLAAHIAKSIWISNGGREWADSGSDGLLLVLEALVAPHLNDVVVRSALALRYLSQLEDSLRTADYEDARALAAELRWAAEYIETETSSGAPSAETSARPASAGSRLERLHVDLAARVLAELKAAEIAA